MRKGPKPKVWTREHITSRIVVDPATGCWNWTGATNHDGYALGRNRPRQFFLHRKMWELTYGAIPEGKRVLHTCDNPPCVNTAHLFLGTQIDNIRDMVQKRRHQFGERQWNAKLNDDLVRKIRALHIPNKRGGFKIGRMLGISKSLVDTALYHRCWKHV